MNTTPSQFEPFAQVMREGYAPALKDGNEVAVFIGMQDGMGVVDAFPLFNLTRQVGIYGKDSTVSTQTLRTLGYSAPSIPAPDVYASRTHDDNFEPLCNETN